MLHAVLVILGVIERHECWYNAGPASDGKICVHISERGGGLC